MDKIQKLIDEEKWECFTDPAYYDMMALRQKKDKSFTSTIHIPNPDEAKALCDYLNALTEMVIDLKLKLKTNFVEAYVQPMKEALNLK